MLKYRKQLFSKNNRDGFFSKLATSLFQKLCHRRFDIDSSGWWLLKANRKHSFTKLLKNTDNRFEALRDFEVRVALNVTYNSKDLNAQSIACYQHF